jgi:hypothetical protein
MRSSCISAMRRCESFQCSADHGSTMTGWMNPAVIGTSTSSGIAISGSQGMSESSFASIVSCRRRSTVSSSASQSTPRSSRSSARQTMYGLEEVNASAVASRTFASRSA